VSGPLADWIGEHAPKDASWAALVVAKEYALAANHDGMPTHILTPEIIEAKTHVSESVVYRGRAEALGAKGWRVLEKLEHGGGRGKASRFRVVVQLCPAEAGCKACEVLQRERQKASERRTRPEDSLSVGQGKASGRRRNPIPQTRNPVSQTRNPVSQTDTTYTGNGPPLKGEPLPPGESSDRSSHAPPPSAGRARERAQGELEELAARCPRMAGLHQNWHGHLREPAADCPWCVPTRENIAAVEADEASMSAAAQADDEEGQG
jgi:hypothetical protein